MIVKWKSDVALDRFVTEWRGMILSLEHHGTHWRLTVVSKSASDVLECNGKCEALVHQHWASPRHAMEAIDAAMDRAVTQLASTGIVAQQRPVGAPLRLAVERG